jgi:NitT/TauT family transport system ATP-binding protein
VKEIIEVRAIRQAEAWEARASEEVMEMPSFVHLRAQVWKLLRQQMQQDAAE